MKVFGLIIALIVAVAVYVLATAGPVFAQLGLIIAGL